MGFFASKPRVLVDRYVPEMAQLIQNEISSQDYDLVIASGIYMADYLNGAFGVPAIFEEAEIGVFTDAATNSNNFIRRTRNQLTLSKLKSYFQDLLPRFAYSTVVSEEEKNLLAQLIPEYKSFEVIPNGVSLASYNGNLEKPQPGRLIFTGALTFAPNYHAMDWFSNQVLPLVKRTNPEVQLLITGNHGGRKLLNERSIKLVGYVENIRPLISSAWISIAPIFSGGGTRLKILEAFGLHTPVIATSKGAEGLDVQHGIHLLIADNPETFAQETTRLLNDVELRTELSSNAYKLVQEKYDWPVIIPKFLSLIERAV
jgi:glycosyltransferase involved in cell wall biosynthesis